MTVYFVHISDTHIGPTGDYRRHGYAPLRCVEKLVDIINELPQRPDFVIHTGDVVSDPSDAAYALASAVFARLEVPIYYVTGNHDNSADIHHFLPMGPKSNVTADRDTVSYVFEVRGERFLVLDARGPDEIDPQGILSAEQIALVHSEATPTGPPLTVFCHFPALPMNSPWFDANMLIQNGMDLHQALLPARDRLRGVFHGHVHQPMQTMRDGIVYTCAPSAFAAFNAWPNSIDDAVMDPDFLPGYSFVHLLPGQTIVHHHTFPRPK